ncbi:hypothetical protein [Methanopyrus kandleri]
MGINHATERVIIHRQRLLEILEDYGIIEKYGLDKVQEYLDHHWRKVSEPALWVTRELVSRTIDA